MRPIWLVEILAESEYVFLSSSKLRWKFWNFLGHHPMAPVDSLLQAPLVKPLKYAHERIDVLPDYFAFTSYLE